MTLGSIILLISLPWIIIYASYFVLRWFPVRSQSSLPAPVSTSGHRWNSSPYGSTHVFLKHLHLRVQTTTCNHLLDTLAARLAARRPSHTRRFLALFYNAGCVFGVLGMVGALGLLLWTCLETVTSLTGGWPTASEHLWNTTSSLSRRSLEPHSVVPLKENNVFVHSESLVKPIIPGVTVPITHLPVILVAVFLNQIVHEVGHALSAALESVPVLSAGFFFYIYIPSAFVTLPSSLVSALPPTGRLRIIAAGPFHNAILWYLLVGAAWSGVGRAVWFVAGYEDVSGAGKVVLAVDEDSPLQGYLPPGSLITRLDDTVVRASTDFGDIWTSYLTDWQPPHSKRAPGWCVNKDLSEKAPHTCCPPAKTFADSSLSCFIGVDAPTEMYCLDPVPILTYPGNSSTRSRCISSPQCQEHFTCLQPHSTARLLRLSVRLPPWLSQDDHAAEQVVLWSGPRREVLEQVTVGKIMPRFGFLSVGLPAFAELSYEYMSMAALSLYLFNLLPLPFLDGAQLLDALIDFILDRPLATSGDVNLGLLEGAGYSGGATRSRRARHTVPRVVHIVTFGLLTLSITLNILKCMWHT